MWTFLEFIFLLVWFIVTITFTVILAVGLLGSLLALAYEWFSDIWWNLKETWKEYWK